MSGLSQVFHHAPKPVSVNEFRDAVLSICKPRFPMARQAQIQSVGLAISGGVDSMALAWLMSKLTKTYQFLQIADNPLDPSLLGVIVDHKLRPESEKEAKAVAAALRTLDIKPTILSIKWKRLGYDPENMTNIESVARTLRYRAIAEFYAGKPMTSLFVAHHEDDQHETILMRLMSGHGYRGLLGIRDANDIPECQGIHGAYKSGLLDNQKQVDPMLVFRPSRGHLKLLRAGLLVDSSKDRQMKAAVGRLDDAIKFPKLWRQQPESAVVGGPYLAPVSCEEGGVLIYRPLLEFSKDRLRATCEANGVPWFEDATNKDKTMTSRNTIRHMIAHHALPEALQKRAIIAMSKRCRRRVDLEDAEAHRLLGAEAVIRIFDPHVGTLLVDLPRFGRNEARWARPRSRFALARSQAKKHHRRVIAALLIRKLTDYVTPDNDLPSLSTLEKFIPVLFPELAEDPVEETKKAFSVAGTLFQPVPGAKSNVWFLSRAPFATGRTPLPQVHLRPWSGRRLRILDSKVSVDHAKQSPWYGFRELESWDGRYWVTIATTRGDKTWAIRPLQPEYMKEFKKNLSPTQRSRLEEALRYYAPGKIRYTLPAIYGYKPDRGDDHVEFDMTKATLCGLPSLGFSLPGLEDEFNWAARYKMVDSTLLGLRKKTARMPGSGYEPNMSLSRQVRRKRLSKSEEGGRRRRRLRRR